MCGVVDGGIVDGLWGYEAGQSGVGDLFGWFVDNACPASLQRRGRGRGVEPARAPHGARRRPGGRRARPARPRLAQRQPLGARQPRAVRTDRRADGDDATRGRLPGADGVDRVRRPHDRRGVRRRRRAGRRVHRRRRAGQEPAADADLRRRAAPAAVGDRLGTGPGARVGDPRRRRRRRLSGRHRRRQRRWASWSRRCTSRSPRTPIATTSCSPSTRRCTTTSAAAATT